MNKKEFTQGFKDGIPIGLGYFAVSFALGIAMKNAGLNWIDGFFMSLCNLASAGEYAGTQVILASGSYFEMILMTLHVNELLTITKALTRNKNSPSTMHRLCHHR